MEEIRERESLCRKEVHIDDTEDIKRRVLSIDFDLIIDKYASLICF